MIETLFAPKIGNYRRAQFGIVALLAGPKTWLCRIGSAQWDGSANDELDAMRKAAQCCAAHMRLVFPVLMKLKKAGQLCCLSNLSG
jgi:hypothetical protein